LNNTSLTKIHVFALGLCAICAQAIFVRETMALFTGTEFVIGVVLAAWLFWVGIGGLGGGWFVSRNNLDRYEDFARFGIAAALLLPVTVIAIRFGRGMLSQPPGSFPPVSHAIIFSVVVIAPFGLFYGAIYNIASLLWSGGVRRLRSGVSRVYIWEAFGSLGGAALFAFLLVGNLSHLEAALVVAILITSILLFGGGMRRPMLPGILLLAILTLLMAVWAPRIDLWTLHRMFPGYEIEEFRASRYGEVVVASRAELLSFYQGGGRLFSVPEPERAEEIVHIPMLLHPDPRSVLLIGGCLGGGWQEVVKHPTVESVDCLELDGELLALALDLQGTRIGTMESGSRRIEFIEADGRRFLSKTDKKYDVILLEAPPPLNLQWNRYYTVEFFSLVEGSLEEGGVFGFAHPSSENFLSDAQAKVLSVLQSTMKEVFSEVLLLPGSTCHFIGSGRPLEAGRILERLSDRSIVTTFVSKEFLPYRLSDERIEFIKGNIERAAGSINSDTRPLLPIREIALEGDRAGSRVLSGIDMLADLPAALPVGILGGIFLLIFGIGRRTGAPRVATLAVGLGSFLLQLLILLSYQAYTGLLYHAIVILTAIFMAGAALGAYFSMRRESVGRKELYAVHGGFVLLSILLFGIHADAFRVSLPYTLSSGAYFVLSGLAGALTGSYYPLVVRTALPEKEGSIPATFYAWDLFGACIGGSVGGILLVPLVGLAGTVFFIAGLHAAASLLLVGRW
jgi:spermidine synthase